MNGKRARRLREEAGGYTKEPKEGTPWFMRSSLMRRQGNGRLPHQTTGTPVSQKKRERLQKLWGG